MTDIIIGIVVTMIFSAFFSGMEIAFVSSNKMLAEMDREKSGLRQKALSVFYNHPNNFVSTMLVGNNISLVIYGILMAELLNATLFAGMNEGFTVVADTILSTLIVLVTGEFLPKTLFKINPNKTITLFSLPTYVCYVLLFPISRFSTELSRLILRFFGVKINKVNNDKEFSKVDLDYLVQSSIDNAKSDARLTIEKIRFLKVRGAIIMASDDKNMDRRYDNKLEYGVPCRILFKTIDEFEKITGRHGMKPAWRDNVIYKNDNYKDMEVRSV